ncbi:adhesion G protein-coupled receptor G3-like [Acipenser ruthenus]|uniref:adhesion G protein-coupled receptor G3-like n=1 Tax=Acipenser ruthenus TaxID=7906 RepID=UPI00274102E1|nr:adhesion G protein-coupled receptor G3-like [Acipenser ruthenus]XP_058848743.1 adhesion G protein-coupled receptor G3-like [Acipenser ruthenus]
MWLVMFILQVVVNANEGEGICKEENLLNDGMSSSVDKDYIDSCASTVDGIIDNNVDVKSDVIIDKMEKILENVTFSGSHINFTSKYLIGHVSKVDPVHFDGLEIYANSDKVSSDHGAVVNSTVRLAVPKEILTDVTGKTTVVFCMYKTNKLFKKTVVNDQVVGVSVSQTKIASLANPMNITFFLKQPLNPNETATCVFWDVSTSKWNSSGCKTILADGQIHCQCNHMTYFAVLLSPSAVSEAHLKILSTISFIGCGISLACLTITLVMYAACRKISNDHSTQIHINLAAALVLLNLFFLPNEHLASFKNNTLCRFLALMLHYSLLCSFTWMGIEAFHLYRLLCKVFNINTSRYILKLCLVGWGLPAVVVGLIIAIKKDAYGLRIIPMKEANYTNVTMCYITNEYNTLYYIANIGYLAVVFAFNTFMLGVTVVKLMSIRSTSSPIEKRRAWKDICTILGLSSLLGTTWGLAFFTFGPLSLPGLYFFCVLNSLQGVFIFLWFCALRQKASKSSASSDTHSTKT